MSAVDSSVPTGSTTTANQYSTVQYVYANPATQHAEIKYRTTTVVKWVSCIQMVIAVLCVVLQAVTLNYSERLLTAKGKARSKVDSFYMYGLLVPDEAATGIWAGLLMVLTAAIGIASWKKNKSTLIVVYLVLSALLIPVSISLIGTSAGGLSEIKSCRQSGVYVSIYWNSYSRSSYTYQYSYHDSYYYYKYSTSTPTTTTTRTTTPRVILFGEDLGTSDHSNDFFCKHPMFRAWLVLDALLLVTSMAMFILSLLSLIYSSKAACVRGGCCSCCGDGGYQGQQMVVYPTQLGAQSHQLPMMYGVPANAASPPVMYHPQPYASGAAYPPYPQQSAANGETPQEKTQPPPYHTPEN